MDKPLSAFVLATLVALSAEAQQVYKCPGTNGHTVFQQAPCTNGTQVVVRPTNSASPFVAPRVAAAPAASAASAVALQPKGSASEGSPSGLGSLGGSVSQPYIDGLAARCLDWYRPLLRDPKGAYFSKPSYEKERRILLIGVHATNGFGGYNVKQAECEIVDGRIDERWTKLHAERSGWLGK